MIMKEFFNGLSKKKGGMASRPSFWTAHRYYLADLLPKRNNLIT